MDHRNKYSGFSLVELSIVLVILGLLTGGILAGQSLIRAAELRSVSSDIQRYTAAIYGFRDKYFQLPGDMNNATSFWGAAHATPATCITTVGTGTQTCNGNGNGSVALSTDTVDYEAMRAWQHLANAGLIEGTYSGVAGPANALDAVIGTNVPRGRLSNTGYLLRSLAPITGHTDYFDGRYDLALFFGTDSAVLNYTVGPALKPEEAWNVDTKMDDGKPALGSVKGLKSSGTVAPNCATTATAAAEYSLSNSAILCPLVINISR